MWSDLDAHEKTLLGRGHNNQEVVIVCESYNLTAYVSIEVQRARPLIALVPPKAHTYL